MIILKQKYFYFIVYNFQKEDEFLIASNYPFGMIVLSSEHLKCFNVYGSKVAQVMKGLRMRKTAV